MTAAFVCLQCGHRGVVPHGGGFKCRDCGTEEPFIPNVQAEQTDTGPVAIRPWIAGDLRPGEIWCNVHTDEETRLTTFTSRVERIPDTRGGFRDDPQLVVHHTSNVPPGFERGYGDDLASFLEHWQPKRLYKQTVTKSADPPITRERRPATLERPGPRHDGGDRHASQD